MPVTRAFLRPPNGNTRKKLRPENRLILPGFQGVSIFSRIIVATIWPVLYIPPPISLGGEIWGVKRFCSNADD